MKLFKLFNKHCKKYLWCLAIVVALTFILNYIRSLVPLFIGKVFEILGEEQSSTLPQFIDRVFDGKPVVQGLLYVLIGIVITCAIRELINIIYDIVVGYSRESIGLTIQNVFFNRVQELPYGYLNRVETGDLIQRSTNDINRVKMFYGNRLPTMLSDVLKIVIYSSQIFIIDVQIGLITLAFVPIILLTAIIYFKKMNPTFVEFEEDEGKLSTIVQENLTGIRVVKAFANEDIEIEKERKQMNKFSKTWKRMMDSQTTYWPLGDVFGYLMLIVGFTIGVLKINAGVLKLNNVVSLILFIEYIMWPTRQLGRCISELGRTNIAAERILDVCDKPSEFEIANGNKKPEIKGNIKFDDVTFKFDDATEPVFKNLNFEIKAGETVAIIGKTGSGKSTLVSLINRLFDPTNGDIYIDGVNTKDIEKHYLRSKIALVLQEPFLFAKSIAENIDIVEENVNKDIVKKVADIASVSSDIERFEQGYDTLVGERGVTLSGGQKQRISIARAIVEEKPILIFDDSLSAVDAETDLKIREQLHSRKKQSTTLIITHRIVTAMSSDKIIVIDDGKISNIGSHEELIKQEGLYKKIWEIQNSFEKVGE